MRGDLKIRRAAWTGLVGLIALVISAAPAAGDTFTFKLRNHPDGNAGPPLYGLRLDELFNVTSQHDRFTLDFDHPSSNMMLIYEDGGTPGDAALSDDTVQITGTAFGGLDTGVSYGNPMFVGLWAIDFTYQANIVSAGLAGVDIKVNPDSPSNSGSITSLFGLNGGAPIPLVDEDGGKGFSFKFNNTDNHRLGGSGLSGPETFVGWGWLNHHDDTHISASDWLFIGERTAVIPEPSTFLLLASGLVGVGIGTRRRIRKES